MDQERTANHILRDLVAMGLVDPERVGEIRPYLMATWLAGWEDARSCFFLGHNKKQIGQYNKQGQLIAVYASQKDAAAKTGYTRDGIYKAVLRGDPTKQGWIWKYVEEPTRIKPHKNLMEKSA